ncbi:MAG: hypothetical protein WB444_01035 [Gallionella sp.]
MALQYNALGMNARQEMEEIAIAAEGGKPTAELQQMASDALMKCVACHAAWRPEANK